MSSENTMSAAPGTPQTNTKAYVASGLAFLTTFVGVWIADTDPFTAKEIAGGLITAAIASGITGGATYTVKNRAL